MGRTPVRYSLLGSFEILTGDGQAHASGTSKMSQVLALLLMRPGRVVGVDTLVEELWGDKPPRSAVATLQTYVYHSRRLFEQAGLAASGRALLHTQSPGYRMEVDPRQVDAKVFERMVHESRSLLDRGAPDAARRRLLEAAGLWRGPVLAGITAGSVLAGHIAHLEELKIRAIEMRIESSEQLGCHREIIPELRSLVAAYPLNEWFHARLIIALVKSGRRAEALHAYHELRRTLGAELGLEPGPELSRIKQEILGVPDAPATLTLVDESGRVRPRRRPPFRV